MSSISFPYIRKTGLDARVVSGARHIRHRIDLTLGGKGELEVRRSHSLSLDDMCLHDEAEHVIYGMVVGQEVDKYVLTFGESLLSKKLPQDMSASMFLSV